MTKLIEEEKCEDIDVNDDYDKDTDKSQKKIIEEIVIEETIEENPIKIVETSDITCCYACYNLPRSIVDSNNFADLSKYDCGPVLYNGCLGYDGTFTDKIDSCSFAIFCFACCWTNIGRRYSQNKNICCFGLCYSYDIIKSILFTIIMIISLILAICFSPVILAIFLLMIIIFLVIAIPIVAPYECYKQGSNNISEV